MELIEIRRLLSHGDARPWHEIQPAGVDFDGMPAGWGDEERSENRAARRRPMIVYGPNPALTLQWAAVESEGEMAAPAWADSIDSTGLSLEVVDVLWVGALVDRYLQYHFPMPNWKLPALRSNPGEGKAKLIATAVEVGVCRLTSDSSAAENMLEILERLGASLVDLPVPGHEVAEY